MDDLLASIRKIISDDGSPRAPRRAPEPPRERAPLASAAGVEDGDRLVAVVERSLQEAMSAADAALARSPVPAAGAPRSAAVPSRDEDVERAANFIAEAIAAERGGRRSVPVDGLDGRAGFGAVLSEPGLDSAAIVPPAPEERAAAPEPLPFNIYPFDASERVAMTETAAELRAPEGEGNVFRRTAAPRPEPEEALTSPRTRTSVGTAFDQLSRTILSSNPRTLEDLVREMIRPMLREWLEANLPDIVERQVRQEIDRVSARGR